MPPVEFELTISAGERPQTYAVDRAASGTGRVMPYCTDMSTEKSTSIMVLGYNVTMGIIKA